MNACRISMLAPALALMLFGMGCTKEIADDEPVVTSPAANRELGERCWTSGAPPCAPGLACLPDPAFADIPGEPDSGASAPSHAMISSLGNDSGSPDPFAGDPGARPWVCQPSP